MTQTSKAGISYRNWQRWTLQLTSNWHLRKLDGWDLGATLEIVKALSPNEMFSVDLVTAGKLSDLRQASLTSKNVNYIHVFEASKGQNLSKIPLFQLWQRWFTAMRQRPVHDASTTPLDSRWTTRCGKHGICHHLARIHEQNGFSRSISSHRLA